MGLVVVGIIPNLSGVHPVLVVAWQRPISLGIKVCGILTRGCSKLLLLLGQLRRELRLLLRLLRL